MQKMTLLLDQREKQERWTMICYVMLLRTREECMNKENELRIEDLGYIFKEELGTNVGAHLFFDVLIELKKLFFIHFHQKFLLKSLV